MTRNFKLFAGAAVLFFLAGAMNERPALYVMAGVCLACILGCYIISRMAIAGLDLNIEPGSPLARVGQELVVQIRLSNIGIISRPAVPLRVDLENRTVGVPPTTYLFPLPGLTAGQSVTTSAALIPMYRGEHVMVLPRLIGSDPLGMFNRPGPPLGLIPFVAVCRPLAISREDVINLLSERTRMQMASNQRRRGEFIGIRRHEPGDDLRDVHWKMTAHVGELVVKKYSGGRDYHAAVWLDTRTENVIGRGPDSSFETQVVAAASLMQALSDLNLDIGLYGDGLDSALRTPDRGRSTLERLQLALAEVKPNARRSFAAATREWVAQTRPGITVFALISGAEPEAVETLRAVAVRGIGLRVIICGSQQADSFYRRRQALALEAFRAAGVPSVISASQAQLPEAFSELARMRATRAGGGVVM
jgi:uncharacterized protein (DUF58 family)